MNEKIAKENKIPEYQIGSRLYGTHTINSDVDISGVFMPTDDMIFGFERVEQIDLSIKSKREDGRNDKDAVDVVLYEIRKFIRLAMDNNPNILEQLFIPSEQLMYSNWYGDYLLSKAELFPHQGLKNKFLGYAFAQKHKMIIRTENYHALENAMEWFTENIKTVEDGKKLIIEFVDKKLSFLSDNGNEIQIGDLHFQKHLMIRKVKNIIEERLSKATNRKTLLTKYGYDVKFGSHLIRLMLEGYELLSTGRIELPLKYKDVIIDIKTGKWEMSRVLKYSEELENDVENIVISSELPKKPRYKEIQMLTKKLLKLWINMQY